MVNKKGAMMSNQRNRNRENTKPQTKPVEDEVTEETPVETETVEEETTEEAVDEVTTEQEDATEETEVKTGKVVGCKKLRLRKTPDTTYDNVIVELVAGTEVTIKEDQKDWLLVETKAGVGFVMSKYIEVK